LGFWGSGEHKLLVLFCGDKNWGSNFRCDQELELRRLKEEEEEEEGGQKLGFKLLM
jgi:hypothetical protein